MTLEDLCECNADALEKLTDKELEVILAPYFTVTRPELAEKPKKSIPSQQQQLVLDPKKRAALAMLAEEGVDLNFLTRKKR